MKLLFPLSFHTKFSLEEAGYRCYGYEGWKDTYMVVNTKTKVAEYSHTHNQFKLQPHYIPKVLTSTSLLDQIPLLVALGLPEKEIIGILRS